MTRAKVFPLSLLLLAVTSILVIPKNQDVSLDITYAEAAAYEVEIDYVWMSMKHAVERHGPVTYKIVEVCKTDPIMKFENKATGRKAVLCKLDKVFAFTTTMPKGIPSRTMT